MLEIIYSQESLLNYMYTRRKIKVTVNLVDALLIKWWSAFIAIQCRQLSFLSSKVNKKKLLIDTF